MERNQYLQHPLVEGVVYEITDSKVEITSPHTVFLSAQRVTEIPLSEIRQLFRKLKKEAKDSGKVRLNGVSKFLPTICTLYPSYHMAVEQINKLFSEIVEMVRKIEADGIHSGCADDELLREARDIKQKTESFSYRNTDYFRYVEHYQNIREILSTKPWKGENVARVVIRLL